MNLDPDVQKYLVDQFLTRLDMVAWAFTALLIGGLARLYYRPVVDVINQIGLTTVYVINALRRK